MSARALLFRCLLLGSTALGWATGCAPAEPPAPAIEEARFKYPLPGKTVSAGYFNLRNPTAAPLVLTGVQADIGSSVEIHRTIRSGDQVRMERLTTLTVEPGSTLRFEPGSYHLMLFGLDRLPAQTTVTLEFADGRRASGTFAAEPW
ncbi:MAG: copper chaperone PCu(A)C [Pseudomonadota bacterium]